MTQEEQNQTIKEQKFYDNYDKALIIVILAVVILQIYLFSQLEHIASPIFGGDLYRERGFVQYLLNGNEYWTDPYFAGELEFYPPLGYLVAATIVKITGVSIDTTINFSPIIITPLIMLAFYSLGKTIFKRKKYAFLLALIGLTQQLFPVKHTYGMAVVFAIFFLSSFLKLEYNNRLKTKILAGIFLGLTALSHYQPFLYTGVMVSVLVIIELLYQYKTNKKIVMTVTIILKKYVMTAIIAVLIALIFFAPLILKYHMQTPNRTQEYSQFDINKNGISWVASTIFNQFIQINSTPNFLLGILGLAGILACILNINKTEQRYSLYLLFGTIISGGHYLITKPLFNVWIVPSHMFAGLFIPFTILTVWGAKFFETLIEKYSPGKSKYLLPILIIIIILPLINNQTKTYNNDRWVQYGRQTDPSTQAAYDMGKWVLENTNNKDVFLANDESAFALNALTGRHVVTVRRTHASPYADVDKRYADAIVMFYGNKPSVVKELLQKYSVKYIYIDQFLLSYPMITNIKFKDYLKQNGISYIIQNVRLDPADANTPQYESIVVQPQNLTITNISTPIKQFNAGNQPFSIMYTTNT